MTPESTARVDRSRIVKIALIGAVPLSCIGSFTAVIVLLFTDDPRVPASRYLELAAAVLFGSLAAAWLPLPVACKLHSRGEIPWAYAVALIPPVLLAVVAVLLVFW